MSHMAAIDLQITNIDDLEQACNLLGLQLIRNKKNWKWFGSWVNDYHAKEAAYNFNIKPEEYGKCADHVICIPNNKNAYEIGVVQRRDGNPGWLLVYDFYGSGQAITNIISGQNKEGKFDRAGKLKQAYVQVQTSRVLKSKGFDVRVIKDQSGIAQCIGYRKKQQGRFR